MQYKCDFCQDTGSLNPAADLLDCSHCDATTGRIALNKWLADQYKQGGMARTDSLAAWRIHQRALAMASKQEAPQPAPEIRTLLRDSLASGLIGIYYCGRVWEAWDVGTMTQEDFTEAAEVDGVLDELCDLAIAALRPDLAAPAVANGAPELPEPMEIDWPTLNRQALGCGVEDRAIHCHYDAAEYGWEKGVERAIECVPDAIYDADQMRAYGKACAAAGPDAALGTDAIRYRWLRDCDWFSSELCVLRNPKQVLTKNGVTLGADCPSRFRLDEAIDKARVALSGAKGN